jgi:7-keto-8-aminopelargonate synthetase-like enzyme
MAPASAAAALAALERLQAEPQLAESARRRAELFRGLAREAGLNTGLSRHPAAVVPIITGDAPTALRLADRLRQRGINVQPFIPPAVEDHQSRLRFFLTARHSEQAIAHAVEVIAAETAQLAAQAEPAARTELSAHTVSP